MRIQFALLIVFHVCTYEVFVNAAQPINQMSVFEAASNGDLATVRKFVANGGNVDIRDDRPLRGYTLLMCAVEGQSPGICEYLLKKGADVNLRSKSGVTAVILANQMYTMALPAFYEKRIASAEKRLKIVMEDKYLETTRKRLELYRKQYEQADTSEEAQIRAKRIVEMLEKSVAEQNKKQSVSEEGSNMKE